MLSAENKRQFFVPPGFAHGFAVLSETALFAYKCTELYAPQNEVTLAWNDPEVGIQWPLERPAAFGKGRARPAVAGYSRRIGSLPEPMPRSAPVTHENSAHRKERTGRLGIASHPGAVGARSWRWIIPRSTSPIRRRCGGWLPTTRPNVVVNAAAYTAVDKAETEKELCHQINATGPGVLAEEAKKIGALLVHYSTDYIFDGTKPTPYVETDAPNPLGAYGESKLAGDQAVRASGADHLIFRLCWVYGARGQNFLLTMQRLAREREKLRVVRDQFGCPTWSRMIAEATALALQTSHRQPRPVGLQRRVPSGGQRLDELARVCVAHHRVDAGGGPEMPRG